MTAEVVKLYEHNFRDPAGMLRSIADGIEAGEYGDVGTIGVVLIGDTMEVFGGGKDGEAPSVALLLHSGFLRLSKAIEEAGK